MWLEPNERSRVGRGGEVFGVCGKRITSSLRKEALVCGICPFPWCKYFQGGRFQVATTTEYESGREIQWAPAHSGFVFYKGAQGLAHSRAE